MFTLSSVCLNSVDRMVLTMSILCIFLLFDVLSITSGRSVEGGKDADVLIVGGGISGLAAAGRLEKAGLKVTRG